MNIAYTDFIDRLIAVIKEIAPLKKICIKNNSCEWIDQEILNGIRNRDKLFAFFKKTGLYCDHIKYKRARNNLQQLIKNKKRNFISSKLTENIGKPKELWKILKGLGMPSKTKSASNICLEKDGNFSFDPNVNCEIFRTYFGNLAQNLLNKLPTPTNVFGIDSVHKYYEQLNIKDKQFSLRTTSNAVVLKLLDDIEPSKAVGLDDINGQFLKDGAVILAEPIRDLFNLSIKLSTFPADCKLAKLKPLYKKGSKLEPKNYRPISLLPLISKIFEKIIHAQTQLFLDENNILYKFQSGFRVNHSTDTSLSYLNNKIMNGFENKSYTGMILIDLQKAFDTIDHEIFLNKIKCLGFADSSISWYKSYLKSRYFKINIDNSYSEKEQLLCGVPQGSILGPLMFLIYINDMAQSVDCDLYLFADDACIVYTGKDIKTIETNLNKNFNSLCDWLVG